MIMPEQPQEPHKRRVRYSGTHPRRFEEKYKELNPEKFAGAIERITAKGLTPAGTHRPVCVREIIDILHPKPGETGLDATLGFGGHAGEILPLLRPGGRLFAVDVDPVELARAEARLRGLGFSGAELIVRKMNFAGIAGLLPEAGGGFDLVLADLGVSSMQLDNPARGFSYKFDGPLDLRLNPSRGTSAAELLKSASAAGLAKILADNADEPHAEAVAKAVKACSPPVRTTAQLAAVVAQALKNLPEKINDNAVKKSLQRVFMALRISVNDEFSALDRFLEMLPWCMKPGARAAILSFHSGEDRRVKKSFLKGLTSGIYSAAAPSPLRPGPEERRSNPRSSCAKLRWAVRSAAPMPGA